MSHFRGKVTRGSSPAIQILPLVPQFRIVPPAAHYTSLSPSLIVPPPVLPTFPVLRVPVSSCFVVRNLSLCETEGLKNPSEVQYLLSELSNLLIAVAQRSGRNAFRCTGRPQIRLAFLLVFCHGCRPHRVKSAVTNTPVAPISRLSSGCHATTVEDIKDQTETGCDKTLFPMCAFST